MRNILSTAVALSVLMVPSCFVTTQAGPSVQVSISTGFSYCDDCDQIDWDNAFIIDENRLGIWVMMPTGRWVLRCRNIWFVNNDWRFGPWWDDYSISYSRFHSHFSPIHAVSFHWYMEKNYRPWHMRYFRYDNGRWNRNAHVRDDHNHDRHISNRTTQRPTVRTSVTTRDVRRYEQPKNQTQTTVHTKQNRKETQVPVRTDDDTRIRTNNRTQPNNSQVQNSRPAIRNASPTKSSTIKRVDTKGNTRKR